MSIEGRLLGFSAATRPNVLAGSFHDLVESLEGYDTLTIGSSAEHIEVLKKAVEFGGGCLKVIFDGSLMESLEIPMSQPEALFAIEEIV